jgi:CheY-like chemotaxis protein
VLALSLWDLSARTDDARLKLLAVSFAVTSILELVHVVLTIEWSRSLVWIARSEGWLRPATWPPAAYVLPIGAACSVWLARGDRRSVFRVGLALAILSAALLALFYSLPRYTEPGLLGISRPTLIPVPLLWAAVGVGCWRRRAQHRVFHALAFAAAVLVLAHAAMLYSLAPHDTAAMVAHLGKVCGYLTLLLLLMQMAARDSAERLRAEQAEQRGERFAVVITDLGMPYVDGRIVAAAIKARSPATPIVLLTGWGHRLIADKDVPEHVNRILAKPPKLVELRAVLAEMTESRRHSSA